MSRDEAQNKILEKANVDISPETQQTLNQPLAHPEGIDKEDHDFLLTVVEKIDKGEIKLFTPSTLLNKPVYENLSEQARAKAELDAFSMLSTLREIHKLWQSGQRDTYQIENLVHRIRLTKERLEEIGGDIFII